jgi:hypothetical protein
VTFDASAIPQALSDRPQWLIWRYEPNPKKPEGKPLKVPYYAGGGRRVGKQGDDKDRAKLVALDVALAALERTKFTGIGFAFLPGDGLIGIDIDGCIDQDTGEISPMADGIVSECLSYTEYSPSRRGFHIIVAGETETFKSDKIGLEVFCGSQFFTFTGTAYAGVPLMITPIADTTLARLRKLVMDARASERREVVEQAAPSAGPRPRSPYEERARVMPALAAIRPDDFKVWIKIGMGLFNEFGDGGFAMWDDWSAQSAKYAGPEDLRTHWESFRRVGVQVTIGAIYGIAKEFGWEPPRLTRLTAAPKSPPPPENEPPPGDALSAAATGTADDPGGLVPPLPTKEKLKLRLVEGNDDVPGEEGPDDAAWEGAPPPVPVGEGDEEDPKRKLFWASVRHLLKHFVLLYGTDTAWDDANELQIRIAHMRFAFGSDSVKYWLGSDRRRMINYENLVFDPTGRAKPPTHVNLFRGFDVQSKQGKCEKIMDLLLHLCNGDEDLFLWNLRWIAYPLRNPGAKMTTAIVMHGDEGSGKNLFWEEIVCRLYGEYGGVIGNAQIETQYNEWVSRKLFFVCDEVVTRNELRQIKGKLKAMISGKRMNVNPKHLPERSEANHMNFVFLSNELQPIALDQSDRRYLVVWTPPKRDLQYYKDVADEADNGGIEAFYHLLMHELDMGDFNEHTKPMDTEAKQDLITLGLDAPERFYREWAAKCLPLPYIPCGAMQLYWAFQRWCHLNGERFPPTQALFARKMLRQAGPDVRKRMVSYDLENEVKQRTVYLVGEQPAGRTQEEWVEGASRLFDKHLKKYRHVYDQSELPNEE